MLRIALVIFIVFAFFGLPGDAKTGRRKSTNRGPLSADQASLASQAFGPDIFRNLLSNRVAPHPGSAYNFLAGAHPVAPYFVPVPIVVPSPPPPPPGPKCYTNKSGYLCCNVTLENTMFAAYENFKRSKKYSECNVHKMADIMGTAAENRFNHTFETIAAHKDFVAKSRFSGDLNCKIEIDGKYFLAYATPSQILEPEVNIIDGNSFFGFGPPGGQGPSPVAVDEAGKQFAASQKNVSGGGIVSGTSSAGKPTYLLYGPLR
ncbi:hypothetical protein L596_028338 [Steinernema carpocapsae]|uniref:Ground-like domain-containing protein n=1 Tax=Steinernema carpocapsae TaxID=34508 RepID=A0A4U5LY43_STECR|nr:hypothetical protein L596_028338 [Steinernema carpocapsae]